MSIRKTIIVTAAIVSAVAMVAPSFAGAVTIDELLAQIAQLQAQLLALQQAQGTTSGTVPAACVGVTFTRNLTVGSTGSDVKCLQVLLNNNGYQVAAAGAGSPGSETSYFGSLTLAAVKKFQVAKGWTPANQVGPLTRAALNSMLTSGGGTTPVVVPTGTGLTVQLASDNPASGTLVSGTAATDAQGGADLIHLLFLNGDNAEVKVTALSLKRIGVSEDALLNNVYLYDGANRLTDGASVSSGIINFNDPTGLFTVPAGGSKTIRVLVDTVYGKSGETVGIQLVDATSVTSNASSVKGTFPVTGNLHTTAATTLATVAFATTTTPSATSGTVDPQNDYTVWQNVPTIGTRAVTLKRFALRQTGSALVSDVQNYRLYVDGVQAGSAVTQPDSNGYITFDLSANPVRLETGARTIKVWADIIGGSSKTIIYSLRASADAAFTDTQVGVDVVPTGNSTSTTGAFAQRITGTTTINSGSVTFVKATDSPSGNVVLSAPNATIAKYKLTAAGEPVKISDLYVYIYDSAMTGSTTSSYFRNGALYANGVQVGSTTNIMNDASGTTGTHFSLGSSLIVTPGTPTTLEVRADIHEATTSGTAANNVRNNDSIYAVVVAGSSNAEGRVSKTTISTPSSAVQGNSLTVKYGTVTLSKYTAYTNQSMVPPLTEAKIAHFTLTAATTEAVNINTIELDMNYVSAWATNLYVKFGDQTTTIKQTVANTNTWSVNYTLAAGQTKDLIVYADINSSATGTGYTAAYVAGTTVSSATSATAGTPGACASGTTDCSDGTAGQAIAFTSGSFTPNVDGTTPASQIVAGGQLVAAGKFKFTTLYDDYTIKELRFTVGDGTTGSTSPGISAAIDSAVVKDGDTVLKCGGIDCVVPYNSSDNYFNFTGLAVAVPANTTKVLTLAFNVSSTLSSTKSTSQVDLEPALNYVKYMNSQGSETTLDKTTDVTTYDTEKNLYVFRSIPTVTELDVVNSTISNGTAKNIYSVKVAADAKGSIAVKQMKFALTWDDAQTSTLQLYNFKLFKDQGDISDLVTITDEDGHDLTTLTAADGANEDSAYAIVVFSTEDVIGAGQSTTYILQASPYGFGAADSTAGADGFSIKMASDTAVNNLTAGAENKYLEASNTPATSVVQLAEDDGSNNEDAKFIWSDRSDLSHASTVAAYAGTPTSSGDWANGYLVKSISSFAGEAFYR